MSAGHAAPGASTWVVEFVALAAIWGGSFLFMRLGAADFGPMTVAFLRCAIAALVLLPWLAYQGRMSGLRQHWGKLLIVGTLNCAIPFSLFAFAVAHITTGLASVLNAATPLFGALVAWLWLKDRLNASRVVGLCIGVAGVIMLASGKASFASGASLSAWAVLACLLATLLYGLSGSFIRRYMGDVHPSVTATGSQIGSAVSLAVPSALTWPAVMPGGQSWAAIVFLGVVCTAIAYILYFRLMTTVGPARALSVTFLIPVFGVVYGAALLGEAVTSWMLVCAVVIVVGTALASGVVKFSKR